VFKKPLITRVLLPMLAFLSADAVHTQSVTDRIFEAKKAEYLRTDGAYLINYHEKVWAWLEKLRLSQITASSYYVKDVDGVSRPVGEVISKLIRCWGAPAVAEPGPPYPIYGLAWCWGNWSANTELAWILLKYDNAISNADKLFLQKLFDSHIANKNFGPGTENSRIHDMAGRYLYAQYRKDVSVQFSYNPSPSPNIFAFSWRGRSYVPGNVYNAYELARDWIQYHMDLWVRVGNREMDSPAYTWPLIHAFCALYECAVDPEMQRMAQMTLDFLLLESGMDYSAKHWGGALGRSYETTYEGRTSFYWDFFWNFPTTAYAPAYDVLMSGYRLPSVIWDAVDLSDEPDIYYHINMENSKLVDAPGTGKWNYVTKFFNLGGRITSGWTLNINSADTPGSYNHPGIPFTLWINTFVGGQGTAYPAGNQAYPTLGELGYQYKNAVFVKGTQLHVVNSPNKWDIEQTDGAFQYFKEGRTMVAVTTNDSLGVSGIEVDIEGVDYADFTQFKNAIRSKCSLKLREFKTSKGDALNYAQWPATGNLTAQVKKAGDTKYQWVWPFPFQRIQSIDHRNQVIVHWEGDLMIVKRHGVTRTYDFNRWTPPSETTGGGDPVPPGPPQGVTIR
jgi:hypothetical protein